jgi:tetratricopeptide (TPR) repeat protein
VHAQADGQAELRYLLGDIYFRESEYAKAAAEERRAIAAISHVRPYPLELSRFSAALAQSLERMGAIEEAMQLHERALAIASETLGVDHPRVLTLKLNYGRALKNRGRRDEARIVLEQVLRGMSPRYVESHPDAAKAHGYLSELEFAEGHLERAANHARGSLRIYERSLSPDHASVAEAYTNLANVELMRRRFADALSLYQQALEIRRRHFGDGHYQVGLAEGSVAETLLALGRYEDATAHLVVCERILRQGSGREAANEAWILTVRGEILVGQHQFAAAVPVLERALVLFGGDPVDRMNYALALYTLACALLELGVDLKRVRSLAERAHDLFVEFGSAAIHERDAAERFLARWRPEQRSESDVTTGQTTLPRH